jgi:predicted nucleotidyltransferase
MEGHSSTTKASVGLPVPVEIVLNDLIAAAGSSFGADLRSVVLFGSGAEGRLRATSDVNLLFILRRFDKDHVDPFRDPLRTAYAAARTEVMFVLDSELEAALQAFAMKFGDIVRRHRLLYGEDLMAGLAPSREARIERLKQVLLNLAMRLRRQYAVTSLREEQLAVVIADAAGPLRTAAAGLLELEGRPAASPKEALAITLESLTWDGREDMLQSVSQARETRSLPAGVAPSLMFRLIELCGALRVRVERLERHDAQSV